MRTCLLLLFLLPTLCWAKAPSPEGQRWWSHVEALAGDELEGRDTGSPGYLRAAEYVAAKLAEAGVQPGTARGFFQDVPFISQRLVWERSRMSLIREGKETPLEFGKEVLINSASIREGPLGAELVFVGYGLSIPEAGHDDLAGQDLQGKIAVVLSGGIPKGVSSNLAAHYGSRAERAAALLRAGAVGMLLLPNPSVQEVPWERVVAGARHPVMMLDEPALQDGLLPWSATFNPEHANTLLAGSGHTLEELVALADAGKPLPHFALPTSIQSEVALERAQVHCRNVVGRLPGSDPTLAAESVVLTAHLDHVGVGEPLKGDRIYNGAMDNASGVAALLEVARSFQQDKGPKPRRTLLFVAVTGEEKGLLGSRWFAERPPEGSGRIVANLNTDMFLPIIPFKELLAYGAQESSLSASLEASAKRLGLRLVADPNPQANAFVRSDQYSFIRKGIPALALKVGYRKGSREERLMKEWRSARYHGPADDLSQPVNLEAAVRFVRLMKELSQGVANAPSRPRWNDDSFFRRFAPQPPVSPPAP
ncbi:M28 family metallopeptidase [Cystobacter ferrugineus]|uniref:Peptidase M28 n=1 Tax=Cystobacter ferrugineus TaxID=83449 RepID=A0A1L9AZ06_9BACT|nr:M28 family metallopeptidase [Cystobacter ferrugineus]OJH35248.1 peptidase M28 [Cystobacter ferrugineus]